MRLLLPILASALVAGTPAASPPPSQKPASCPGDPFVLANQGGGAQARKLGELPPAQLYLTVDRKVGECRVPVIVRYGIGAAGSAPPPRGN